MWTRLWALFMPNTYTYLSAPSPVICRGGVQYFKDSSGSIFPEKPKLTPPLFPAMFRKLIETEAQVLGQGKRRKWKEILKRHSIFAASHHVSQAVQGALHTHLTVWSHLCQLTQENWGSERWRNLPKVTQPANGGSGIPTQACWAITLGCSEKSWLFLRFFLLIPKSRSQ